MDLQSLLLLIISKAGIVRWQIEHTFFNESEVQIEHGGKKYRLTIRQVFN
jgi:hemin uptake protein HemP